MNCSSPYPRFPEGVMAEQKMTNMIQLEHFFTTTVNFTGAGLGAVPPAFENLCDRRRSLKSPSGGSHATTNTWKAMNMTNATVQSVPGFWQKWWSAFVKLFNRNGTRACASGRPSTSKAESPKPA